MGKLNCNWNTDREEFGGKISNVEEVPGDLKVKIFTKFDSQTTKSGQPNWIGELSCEVTETCSLNYYQLKNF